MKKFTLSLFTAAAAICIPAGTASAQEGSEPAGQESGTALLDLPLEDLLSIESTSVAKKRQRISESSAAIYVITQEDIRRSSATNIPDLLRTAPGVEVGQLQNGRTVVGVRGFKSIFSHSLLVMVDGRSIYVSTMSGVFWDQLQIPLQDIERIEIVRGPGATLWGANAVNGVINIITKHSSDALGIRAEGRVSERSQEANLSYGDRIGETLSYRLAATVRHDNGPTDADGDELSKRWTGKSAMARIDWEPNEADAFTLQGERSDGKFDFPFSYPRRDFRNPGYDAVQTENHFTSVNMLARWAHRSSDNLEWSLQAYYDHLKRIDLGMVELDNQQSDVDFGLRWKLNDHHEFNFGLGARIVRDVTLSSPAIMVAPAKNVDRQVSGYVQDDISLIPDKLRITIGSKVEYNSVTGFEYQPSAKLFFRPSPQFALWGGISRAVRTPSRFERNFDLNLFVELPNTPRNPSPLPVYVRVVGNPDAQSEHMVSKELGIRWQMSPDWSLDVSAYLNRYSRLSAYDQASITPIFVPGIPFPVALQTTSQFGNAGWSKTWGGEALIKGRLTPWWKAEFAYSHFDFKMGRDPLTGQAYQTPFPLIGSPRHMASVTSDMDINDRISFRAQLRYVDKLFRGQVPSYFSLDGKISYRITDNVEVALIGENILNKRRLEFVQPPFPTPPAYVPRMVSVQSRFRF